MCVRVCVCVCVCACVCAIDVNSKEFHSFVKKKKILKRVFVFNGRHRHYLGKCTGVACQKGIFRNIVLFWSNIVCGGGGARARVCLLESD